MPGARLSSFSRGRRGDWLLAFVAASIGTLIVIRRPTVLATSPDCPGLVELALVIAARSSSEIAVGSLVASLNGPLTFVALGIFAHLFLATTGSRAMAFAVTLAATSSGLLQPVLAAGAAASLAACGVSWILFIGALDTRTNANRRSAAASLAGFAIVAAVTPPVAIPLAAAATWCGWRTGVGSIGRRALRAIVFAGLVLASAAVVSMALPSRPSADRLTACLVPISASTSLIQLPAQVWSALGMTALALSLTALGVLSLFTTRHDDRPLVIGLAAFVLLTPLFAGLAQGALAPFVLVIWILCAIGLREVRSALTGAWPKAFGLASITTALVVLQLLSVPSTAVTSDRQPRGHDRLSRARFVELIDAIPEGASLVHEDAATALLIRSLRRDFRERRFLGDLPIDRLAMSARLTQSRVFALPRAQSQLQHLGFQLLPVPRAPGLAEVKPAGACSAALTGEWQAIGPAIGQRRFTMTAREQSARGPVYIFALGGQPLRPESIDWPPDALRGFHPLEHDLSDRAHNDRLARDLSDYRLQLESVGAPGPGSHLVRLEIWRTPSAPLNLTVAFDAAAQEVLARLADANTGGEIVICPAYEFTIVPIAGAGEP